MENILQYLNYLFQGRMSGIGIVQDMSEEREYCLQVFYIAKSDPKPYEIHIVVTWNIEAHVTLVRNQYRDRWALQGPNQLVDFESDSIAIDIPMEGIAIEGWKITPLQYPAVTKKQVDNFKPGKLIPHCQLNAEFSERGKKISTLYHRISLLGAKFPRNILTIELPGATEYDTSSWSPTFGDLREHPSYEKSDSRKSVLTPSTSLLISHKSIESEAETKPIPTLPTKTEITGPVAVQPTGSWNLRGVEVCGEMTAVVYSSHTQQITWEDFGLKLYIRKGSLPVGITQCIINIKASLAGQYEFPENSHLISAIFWLRCETVHSFAKKITLEIEHCARFEKDTNLQLSFVKAICSQKQLPYTFNEVGGDFTNYSSYGIIELNSFSGNGVTLKGSNNKLYRLNLFYLKQEYSTFEVHFVVTRKLRAHLTVVMEEYEEKGARAGPDQNIEFESDMITLNIPLKGKIVNGWKITPLIRPVITQKDVDDFKRGIGTPRCQFKVEFLEETKIVPALQHRVTLKGAKYPHNSVMLDIPSGASSAKRSSKAQKLSPSDPPPRKKYRLEGAVRTSKRLASTSTSSQGTSSLDSGTATGTIAAGIDTKLSLRDDYFKVRTYLHNLDKQQIRDVGGALGLSYSNMEKMNTLPDNMVAAWLRREDFVLRMSGEPTWKTLVEALRKVRQEGTAADIEEAEEAEAN